MENIKNFLRVKNEETTDALHKDKMVVWIDWREEDEDIVMYCEKILKTESLSAESEDADNELGFEVIIHFQGNKTVIPNLSRDNTIITLNEVIKPNYDIRFWEDSLGSDTLAIVPATTKFWEQLELEFGKEHVREYFSIIDKEKKMFELDWKEVEAFLKKRGL